MGLKQAENARRRVLLADSRRYRAYSLFYVSQLTEMNVMIMDKGSNTDTRQLLDEQPFNLTLA